MSDALVPIKPIQLDPKTPEPRQHRSGSLLFILSSGLLCAIAVGALLGLCAAQLVMVPRFVAVFQDMDTQLPGLTLLLLSLPSGMLALAYFLVASGLIVKECIPKIDRRIKLLLNGLVVLLCLVTGAFYLIALLLPMTRIMVSAM